MTAHRPTQDTETIIVRIPMFIESRMILQVPVERTTTAKSLCRQLGIYPPSLLCKWPARVPFQPDENIYEAITHGSSPYIRSIEPQNLDESDPGSTSHGH